MPIDERSISLPEQWAKDAQTVIPAPPVPGIAYRNTAITPEQWAHGQDYSRVADSAQWNQMFWTMSGLLKFAEQYGVMPYSPFTDYPESGICMGLDGILYQAVQPSGPNNGGAQPITNGSYWRNYATKFSAPPATPTSLGVVKPQTGDEDGLELGPDGTLRLKVAAPTVRGGVKASDTPRAYTVPHSRADGTIDPAWMPSVLKTSGGQMDGEVVFGIGYAIRRNNDTGALVISGGTSYDTNDGSIILHGKNDPNPGVAGLVELLAGGGRISFGYNGIYFPNNNRVMLNQDIFTQAVPPNGPVYSIPSGGTWSLTRLQWDHDGNIVEVSTQTVAGGTAANISNANAQLLIAYRVGV